MTDFRKDQISEIDNEYLPELPEQLTANTFSEIELYVNKRIGLRKESLDLYQKINSEVFGIMEHPLYIYGKDGHVFYNGSGYMEDYQHLNLDPEYAEEFANNIDGFRSLAEDAGKKFYYLLLPDKKTVYAEYFPEGVNVKGDVSRTDLILDEISKKNINYLFAKDLLLEAKKQEVVYNVEFDAGHWNEDGAFVTIKELLTMIQKDFPELELPDQGKYIESTKIETSLLASRFKIHEEVPVYSLKENPIEESKEYKDDPVIGNNTSFHCYVNKKNEKAPKILVFHDSYFIDKDKFITPSFSEAVFVHRNILSDSKKNFTYLMELVDPDVIVYENCERVFPVEFAE